MIIQATGELANSHDVAFFFMGQHWWKVKCISTKFLTSRECQTKRLLFYGFRDQRGEKMGEVEKYWVKVENVFLIPPPTPICKEISAEVSEKVLSARLWGGASVKNPSANAGVKRDAGWVPESVGSPGGGYGNPLQYSCLKNIMDRGAWQPQYFRSHRVGHHWIDLARITSKSPKRTPPNGAKGRSLS